MIPNATPAPVNQFSSFTKAVWFLLGKEGGRWTVTEILAKVETTWPRNAARYQIGDMASKGLIKRYRGDEGEIRYGITRACKIPRNLTLAEVEELVGVQFVADACQPS